MKYYAAVTADGLETPVAIGTSLVELEKKLNLNPRTLTYYNSNPQKVYKKLNVRVVCASSET